LSFVVAAGARVHRRCGEPPVINRHPGPTSRSLLSSILLFTLAGLVVPAAQAQTTASPPAAAPAAAAPTGNLDAYKTTPSAAPITAWVNGHVAAMSSGAAAAASSREAIIAEVASGKVAPSATFLATFAGALDAAVVPALQNTKSYEARLNAAIAVTRVANAEGGASLANSTIALLNDESPFVVLWGVKASQPVLAAMLRNPAANSKGLLDAILGAVTKHGNGPIGGAIVAEAYESLCIDYQDPNAKQRPSGAALAKVIGPMQDLLKLRVDQYKTGIPPEPLADQRGTAFLAFGAVWDLHKPAEKLTSMQRMSDLVGLAAQQVQNASPGDKDSLAQLIKLVASAIAVVPESKTVQDKIIPATKITAATPAPQIVAAVQPIAGALQSIKAFATLPPPPAATSGGAGDAGEPAAAAGTQPSAATATAPAPAGGATKTQ
jgi:hypothetical protein